MSQPTHSPTAVVLATYNEAPNLEKLLPILASHVPDANIIVVDDNSPDGTPALLERMAAENPRIVPLVRPGKQGYGTAVLAGLKRALELGAERIGTMDADFSHGPEEMPQVLAGLEQGHVAIGSRYYNGVRVLNWQISRLLLSLFANRYVRGILGFQVADATSGFRAYRRDVVEALTSMKIDSTGYSFLVEILFRCFKRGFTIVEVPITYTERREGQSKMSGKVIREAVVRPWLLRVSGKR